MLIKLNEVYKLWHNFLTQFPRLSKYTLGAKIDNLFLDTLELIIKASYAPRSQKLLIVNTASVKLDALKFLLQTAWELELLTDNKYSQIAHPLVEIGKMLGGWVKFLEKETPP